MFRRSNTHIYIYIYILVCMYVYIYVYMRIKLINDYNDCWLIVRYFSVLDHMAFNHQTMGMVIILDSRGDPVLKQFFKQEISPRISPVCHGKHKTYGKSPFLMGKSTN